MFNTITYHFLVYLFTFGNICTLTGSYHFGKDNAVGSPALGWGGFRGFIPLSLFFFFFLFLFHASKMRRFARVLSHGAPNNCHQVQSGNGPLEMRPKKKSPRKASVGSLFVLVSAWVSICASWEHSDPLLKDVQKRGLTKTFTATLWERDMISFIVSSSKTLGWWLSKIWDRWRNDSRTIYYIV